MDRRTGRTGPAGSFTYGHYELDESDTHSHASRTQTRSWRLLEGEGLLAPHHLLSVRAAVSQTPHTVFAQEPGLGSLVSGSICGAVPVGNPGLITARSHQTQDPLARDWVPSPTWFRCPAAL